MSDEKKDLELNEEAIKVGTEETSSDAPVIISAPTEPEKGVIKKRITTEGEDYTPEAVDLEIKSDVNEDSAHDDYDWTIGNKHTLAYSDEEIKNYDTQYSETLNSLSENAIVSGVVSVITEADVILDVNFKADGLISVSEFRDMPELKIGDTVEVYVEQQEDEKGKLILSRRKAKLLKSWENLVDSYTNGTIITGTIISKTKGGLIVDAGGLETFLPGSQIDIKPIIDYDAYVGKKMEFKVVKINEAIKNAVVSHKALIESDLAEQRDLIIAGLEKGQVLEGIVKNITDFGAFMDLGGVDGLLYITDISWGRINHPSEIIELNQKLNVVVLDFDENKKRISLGLKQLQSHPWDVLGEEIKEGSTVKGKIVNIEDYGAFLEITPGVEGLIHVSEVSWSNQAVNAREFFKLGQEFESKVVTIDREDRKMSLSIKQLHADPWMKVIEKFPEGSNHSGEVKNLTPYGVFVELEEGIGGMIHISDLSWTKRYSHPSEFTKVGEKIDIQILEIDQDHRKLSLGHKQLEENPWDTFENVFPVGSYHEATVLKADDRGAIVSLPYGLEAFSPARHLKKEDGTNAKEEDKLIFKVIEFNRDDKRILVSHRRYLEDIKRDADEAVKGEQEKERKVIKKEVESRNAAVEKTTLGELAGFSEMKSAFSGIAPEAPKEAAKPEAKKEEPKKEEAPKAEVKKEEPKKEEAPKAEAKKEEPKKEEAPKAEAKKEEPKKEEAPKAEAKKEEPKKEEAPKVEAKKEESKKEFKGDAKEANIVESSTGSELEQELDVTQGKEQVIIDPDSEVKKIVVPAVLEEEEEEEDDYMPPTAATPAAAAPVAKASGDAKPDDLKKIEGVGPKIAELLNKAGYNTFGELAAANIDDLKKVLDDAGPRYRMHTPDTWPQQSKLAADGKWDELQKLQDDLDGGRA